MSRSPLVAWCSVVAASSLAACQVVAGLSGLEVDEAAGGAGATSVGATTGADGGGGRASSSSETSTSDTSSGSGGGGGADGDCEITGCEEGDVCIHGSRECLACGDSPTSLAADCDVVEGVCQDGAACDATNTCVLACDASNPPACTPASGPIMLDASHADARLECTGGACAGAEVTCMGPFSCTVHCAEEGSCDGIRLTCSDDGPCTLRCDPPACVPEPQPVAIACGHNACAVTCPPDAPGEGLPVEVTGADASCAPPEEGDDCDFTPPA